MRSLFKRALPLAIAASVAFTGLSSAPASAADGNCNYYYYVPPVVGVGVDDPIEGMTGVIYVCLVGVVNTSVGAGVWIHQDGGNTYLIPVICTNAGCSRIIG